MSHLSMIMQYTKPSQEALEALSPQEYEVTQNSATDAPFSHELTDEFKAGLYVAYYNWRAPLRIIT